MARGAVEECMFCGSTPCACNKKPVKKAQPKPHPLTKQTAKIDQPAPPPRAKPAAMPAPLGTKPQRPVVRPPVVEPEQSYEEVLSNAVTALAEGGLLGEDTIVEYENIIKLPPTLIEALKWRSRVRQGSL